MMAPFLGFGGHGRVAPWPLDQPVEMHQPLPLCAVEGHEMASAGGGKDVQTSQSCGFCGSTIIVRCKERRLPVAGHRGVTAGEPLIRSSVLIIVIETGLET